MASGNINVDVKTIIQELVNRSGWVSGNSVNLRARDEAYVAGNGTLVSFVDYPTTGYGRLAVSYTPYTSHTMVNFDGVNDYLRRGATVFSGNPKSLVMYADFVSQEYWDADQTIMSAGALLPELTIDSNGLMAFSCTSGVSFVAVTSAAIPVSTHIRAVACFQGDTVHGAANGYAKLWISSGGGAFTLYSSVISDAGDTTICDVSGATNFHLCTAHTALFRFGRILDASKVDGAQVGFLGVWASTSRTGAIVTDPTIFFDPATGRDRNLSVDLTVGGVLPAPLVAFGGTQTAANWNAGTNQGSAGAFTMSGGV